jgi:hypothetical protein
MGVFGLKFEQKKIGVTFNLKYIICNLLLFSFFQQWHTRKTQSDRHKIVWFMIN